MAGDAGAAEVPGDTSDRQNERSALQAMHCVESSSVVRAPDGVSEQEGAPHTHGKGEHSERGIARKGIYGLM